MLENSNIKSNENEKQYYDEKFKLTNTKFLKYLYKNYGKYSTVGSYIKLKFEHTIRVIDYAEKIARGEGLSEEDVYIAKIVALFHDIGHFKAKKRQALGLSNKGLGDHCDIGEKMLFENVLDDNDEEIYKENGESFKLIDQFLVDEKYQNIIKEAVLYHGKFEIDKEGLTNKEILHAKIIRDADKIDIFNVRWDEEYKKLLTGSIPLEKYKIGDEAYNEYLSKGNLIFFKDLWNRNIKLTIADYHMNTACFGNNLEFDTSVQIVDDEKLIQRMQSNTNFNDIISQIRSHKIFTKAKELLAERINKIKEKNSRKYAINEIPEEERNEIISNLMAMQMPYKQNENVKSSKERHERN